MFRCHNCRSPGLHSDRMSLSNEFSNDLLLNSGCPESYKPSLTRFPALVDVGVGTRETGECDKNRCDPHGGAIGEAMLSGCLKDPASSLLILLMVDEKYLLIGIVPIGATVACFRVFRFFLAGMGLPDSM